MSVPARKTPVSEIPSNPFEKIYPILKKAYPKAKCAIAHKDPLQLLVATILSAQCTDVRVNIVTEQLFKKYRSVRDYAEADPMQFENEIRSTGFFRSKAKNIISCAKEILKKHGGKIPNEMEALTELPGVGRKTANVILGTAFGIASGIVVDTHVKRLSWRMGFSPNEEPEKIEQDLMTFIPKGEWILFSHVMIHHGRQRCTARKADCPGCEVRLVCPRIGVS